jgi:1-acyl-sn-glycerol-3-phosphate acyltransferase
VIRKVADHAWRVVFTGSSFLFFFTGAVLLSYLVLPLVAAVEREPLRRARRCRALVRRAWVLFHDYMRWTGLLRYDPRRTRLLFPAGPFVLVANHPTLVDVTALLAALPDAVVVVKRTWIRSPLVGPVLRRCRHIDAGDGGSFAGVSVFEQAVQHLADGTPVLLFPEGTRSPERGLGEFRLGAFQIAARARVPLVTVLLRCEPPTLMRGQAWYEIPERTAVLSVDPLAVVDAPPADPCALARAVRETYLRALGLAPAEQAKPPATPARNPRPLAAVSGG